MKLFPFARSTARPRMRISFQTMWRSAERLECVLLTSASLVCVAAERSPTSGATNSESRMTPTGQFERGRELAQQYCSTCHLFPEPALLTKTAWVHHILPEMAKWLGLERVDYEGMQDGGILREAKIYPPSPIISEEDWFAIWDYYRHAAPSQPLPQAVTAKPRLGLKQFRVRKLNPTQGAPMTSLVKIDSPDKRLYVGDAFAGVLSVITPNGEVGGRMRFASAPISMTRQQGGDFFTLIGRFFPSDAREGAVLFFPKGAQEPIPLLEQLRRPTATVVADLNGDGRDDLVVCQYGNRLGQFSWFENKGEGRYDEHVLLDRPGAVQAAVRDFNRDGRPDIMVMMAQAREGVYLFFNEGQGRFRMEPVLEQPPTWGYAGFDLADMNGDGQPDLITANGDNGDFALPLKSYHGVRVYLNDGTNHFKEAFFYPMHGAYKAIARDFDGDGDLDLAAIAFYPDFASASPESFVYLENKGGLRFEPFTCAECSAGRWLVMDAGDLDGDGDEDIALGSFVLGPTTMPVPQELRDHWRSQGAAVLLLENTSK
jgi:hypothetical protein